MSLLFLLIRNIWVALTTGLMNFLRSMFFHKQHTDYVRFELAGPIRFRLSRQTLGARLRKLIFGQADRPAVSLDQLEKCLEILKRNHRLKGIVILIDELKCSWAAMYTLREHLKRFRESGKEIVAYLRSAGNLEYYLASVADRIILPESASLGLNGISIELTFYKKALDTLAVKAEHVSAGRYKSASEPFTRTSMSKPSKEALDAVLDSFYDELITAISSNRGLTAKQVRALVDKGPYSPDKALAAGLVDHLGYEDEIARLLAEKKGGKRLKLNSYELYRRFAIADIDWKPLLRPRHIALIDIEGVIVQGESRALPVTGLVAGDRSTSNALNAARRDPIVAAVVLRIDSRGGSAYASDLIWREVRRLGRSKPVIAFMEGTAASGGYYIASAAKMIFAAPNTLTGSIGVVAGKLDLSGLYKKLGINKQVVSLGTSADFYATSRGFSPAEKTRLQQDVNRFYDIFIKRVAEGRNKSKEEIKAVAEGRIWTGRQALELGLVDQLGTLHDALTQARKDGGVRKDERPEVIFFNPTPQPLPLMSFDPLALGGVPGDLLALFSKPSEAAVMAYDPVSLDVY